MKIVLLQPHYPHGKSQTYLPGGLMNLGSRLLQAGVEVSFFDLNFTALGSEEVLQALTGSNFIGFSVLGPPYIPEVILNISELRTRGFSQPVLVGGEGVARIRSGDFKRWFWGLGEVVHARGDAEIKKALFLTMLSSQFVTSMTPMLTFLSEAERRRYLTTEFALFLSNGCVFNCDFYAALKDSKETYRTIPALQNELLYICAYLQRIEHRELRMYLTNLDAFQTVGELEKRLAVIAGTTEKFGITPYIRFLATSKCAFLACRKDTELPARLYQYGVRIIAFGADGADEETWVRENKTHNNLSEIEEATAVLQKAGITVELLMVVGFQQDKPLALWHHLLFSFRKALHGAVIRPYLGKSKTPSGRWPRSEGYIPRKEEVLVLEAEVQMFLDNPVLLKRLDYAMLGSRETHPDWRERWLANILYLLIIIPLAPFGLCPTRPLIPVPGRAEVGQIVARLINRLMPFDR